MKTWTSMSAILLIASITACTPVADPYHRRVARFTVQEKGEDAYTRERIANLPPEELTGKGLSYLNQGNLELARLHFSAALQKKPDATAALAGLGQVFLARGSAPQAREIFTTVLEKDPQNMAAQLGLARIARSQGDYPTAQKLLETLQSNYPESPAVISELAITYDSIGQDKLGLAESLHQKFISLRPDNPSGYNNLGFNYLLQGRYTDAIPQFSRALALEPSNMRSKNNLATAFLLNNQEVRALQLFEDTLGKPAAYNNIGYLYMTQGNWDKAEKAFKKALALNPVFYPRAQQNLDRLNSLRSQSAH
ncbi:tetratricopeptide repeat protein [Syntrophotalea acetylenica]|uniref:Uncharacterized protein n=1 Tax=Syntrophotalea acetylenica TaxID=29542 RepID=A0A1L3GIH2_SYNAC|nr:tetratricopeptide repeat protein [Syntrophotalea acetylenica]APG25736.1 hypothetical protein A7E75_12485 [Syntrophotalea acetylenica]APG43809.1 hypothetical protein A6070_06500 [Syntrophotalea acetylenica]